MPLVKELDSSMTMYIQGTKKQKLIKIAAEDRISYSALLLKIVDEWLENRENGSAPGAAKD